MTVEFDRIPALQLTLVDHIWDDHPEQQHWLGIVALALDDDHVVVTCAGDDQVLRIPATALVGVRRLIPTLPRSYSEGAEYVPGSAYLGDLTAARAAVDAHSREHPPPPAVTRPYPNSHYEGLYGGDLDHVVDAVGGSPHDDARDLRDAATRRQLAEAHDDSGIAAPTSETDEELIERLSGWYSGDIGHIFDRQEP